MAKQKEDKTKNKTNAMRILDTKKIPYKTYTYECDEFIDAIQIADMLSLPHEKVYKTLVTQGASKNYFVFVIPIAEELDMKKAARSVGEKSVAMLHVKDINAVTGYIRGGCTAIGMKAVCHAHRPECPEPRQDHRERRKARHAARTHTAGSGSSLRRSVRGDHF